MNSSDLAYYGKQFAHYGIDIAMPRNKYIASISCAAGYLATRNYDLWNRGFLGESVGRRFIANSDSIWHEPSKILSYYFITPMIPVSEVSDQTKPLVGICTAFAVSITLNIIALAIFGRKKQPTDSPHPLTELLEPQPEKKTSNTASRRPDSPHSDDDAFRELVGFDPMAGVARCWHPCR